LSDTTSLGFPIWDPTGSDSNENVYALLLSLIGTQASSAMRLNETYIQDLKNTKLTIYSKAAADWAADSITVIKSGEFGIETDTGKIKFGNGVDVWSGLSYFSSSEVLVGTVDPTTSVNGKIGQAYINTVAQSIWQCLNEQTHNWVKIYPQLSDETAFTPILTLDENGNLNVTYQEITNAPENGLLGNITGPPGKDGANGIDGINGADGKSGVYYGPVAEAPADAEMVVDPAGAVFTTDNVPEGETNKYYTDERVDERLAQYKIGTTPDLPLFTGEGGAVGTKTAAQALMTLGAAKAPVTQTVTLLADNWTAAGAGYYQIVDAPGMRSTLIIIVSPDPEDFYRYSAAQVSCLAQSYDMLSFNAMQVPTEDLDVNILIVG
jgi:hypothetical protein